MSLNRVEHEEIERISFLESFFCVLGRDLIFSEFALKLGDDLLEYAHQLPCDGLWKVWSRFVLIWSSFSSILWLSISCSRFLVLRFFLLVRRGRPSNRSRVLPAPVQRPAARPGALLSGEQLHRSSPSLSPPVSLCARRRAAPPPALLSLLAFPHRFNKLRGKMVTEG